MVHYDIGTSSYLPIVMIWFIMILALVHTFPL